MYSYHPRNYFPYACTATPGPTLYPTHENLTSYSYGPVVENVDGVNEAAWLFSQGTGLKLAPTTGEVRNDAYSIVVLFRLSELSGYRRLVDFKQGTSDTGLYLQDGFLRFFPDSTVGTRVVNNDEYVQVVVTRAATGTVRGFVDGVQQWQFTDTTGAALISSENRLGYFEDDRTTGDTANESSAGAVARIRVFDRPLSTTEIGALGQTPGSPCTGSAG